MRNSTELTARPVDTEDRRADDTTHFNEIEDFPMTRVAITVHGPDPGVIVKIQPKGATRTLPRRSVARTVPDTAESAYKTVETPAPRCHPDEDRLALFRWIETNSPPDAMKAVATFMMQEMLPGGTTVEYYRVTWVPRPASSAAPEQIRDTDIAALKTRLRARIEEAAKMAARLDAAAGLAAPNTVAEISNVLIHTARKLDAVPIHDERTT